MGKITTFNWPKMRVEGLNHGLGVRPKKIAKLVGRMVQSMVAGSIEATSNQMDKVVEANFGKRDKEIYDDLRKRGREEHGKIRSND